jgi:hypothetical protein
VFYGAGEVAEIGYVSLQGSDFELVGVVDDDPRRQTFFGLPVSPSSQLSADRLDGKPFDIVVIMSFRSASGIRERLESKGFPPERIFSF